MGGIPTMTTQDVRQELEEFFSNAPTDIIDHLRDDCHFYEMEDVIETLISNAQKQKVSDSDMNLEGMSQESLIQLFFDWFDAWTAPVSPLQWDKDAAAKVHAIRMRIDIHTSTGTDSTKGAGQ